MKSPRVAKKWKKRKKRRKKASKKNAVRLILKDKAWKQLSAALKEVLSKRGNPGKLSVRMFIEAVLYIARTGIPWRDLPQFFGNWEAVYMRFRRWEKKGVWRKLWEILQQERFKKAKKLFMDSTIVRAHRHAAGASKKSGGQEAQGLGRSRGGFSTKIHAGTVDENTSVAFVVTAGQRHDSPGFDILIEEVPEDNALEDGIGDKGYDSNHIREELEKRGINPVIPPRKNRNEEIEYDEEKYRLRNQVERFFGKLKEFRRIATRYEKLSRTFLAMIHLVSVFIVTR